MEVSIHTRPEERVIHPPACGASQRGSSFNPHPPRRAGDTARGYYMSSSFDVSIHTRPEERVIRQGCPSLASPGEVSIHTRPEERVIRHPIRHGQPIPGVSIHTRPEERVIPVSGQCQGLVQVVSIHTRPEERVILRAGNSLHQQGFLQVLRALMHRGAQVQSISCERAINVSIINDLQAARKGWDFVFALGPRSMLHDEYHRMIQSQTP